MMKFLLDLIISLVLVFLGLFLLILYVVLRTKADNWVKAFSVLFLFGLAVVAISLGVRRIMLVLKIYEKKK